MLVEFETTTEIAACISHDPNMNWQISKVVLNFPTHWNDQSKLKFTSRGFE